MTQTATEFVVAGSGSVNVAPLGTASPSDPVTPYASIDPAWKEAGFTTEAGVKVHDGKTVYEIKSWQSFYAVRRVITAREFTLAFGLQQWNEVNVPLAFGGGAISTPIAGGTSTLTNRVLTSNVVTLTTSAPHGYGVGQYVVVSGYTGADAIFNGSYTITAVGSSTTFSYALTHADVSTGAGTGSGSATVGIVYKYTPPAAGTIDERTLGIDWVDGSKHYRVLVGKGIVQDAVDTELVKTKEAELPILFGATTATGGIPYTLLTDDPAYAA